MPINTPYANPNWLKQQMRLMGQRQPRQSSQPNMNDPREAAKGLYGAGIQINEQGSATPTRDYGSLLRLNSSQMNGLSRGAGAGSNSSLGQPLNSMYANNPGFFNRGGGSNDFGAQIAARNQTLQPGAPVASREQNIAQAKQSGNFGAIRDQYNQQAQSFGRSMDEEGNISTQAPYRAGLTAPTAQSQAPGLEANRGALEERAAGLKLLREVSSGGPRVTVPTISQPLPGGGTQTVPQLGAKNIEGRYGSGFSTTGPRSGEGLINGRPASEMLQGLANKPGIAREGDKYQPKKWTAEDLRKLNRR